LNSYAGPNFLNRVVAGINKSKQSTDRAYYIGNLCAERCKITNICKYKDAGRPLRVAGRVVNGQWLMENKLSKIQELLQVTGFKFQGNP
jgi:hypothetical protein